MARALCAVAAGTLICAAIHELACAMRSAFCRSTRAKTTTALYRDSTAARLHMSLRAARNSRRCASSERSARSMIHCSTPKLGGCGILESQLCQDLLQPVEATATDKADGSSRQTELLSDLVVRHGRLFIEQQLYQLRAARGEPLNGIAHRLFFLHFLQDHGSGGNFLRQFLLHGIKLDLAPLLLFPMKTLMRGHGNQP